MVRWTLNRFVQASAAAAVLGAGSGYAALSGRSAPTVIVAAALPPLLLADTRPAVAMPEAAPALLPPPIPPEPPRARHHAESRRVASGVRARHEQRGQRWAARMP